MIALLLLSASAAAWAKPATSIKINDQTTYTPPTASTAEPDKHWFVRADVNTDIGLKGAQGFTGSVGRYGKIAYLDFAASYTITKFGALRVTPQGTTSPQSEVARIRDDRDDGNILSFGPGVGMMGRFFGDDRWLQMFRFGVNYSLFSDNSRNTNFHGGLANFEGRFGYRVGSFILAPGINWNMGFYQRTGSATGIVETDVPSDKYLSTQWWSASVSVYLWL